jgi:hypothetical protein
LRHAGRRYRLFDVLLHIPGKNNLRLGYGSRGGGDRNGMVYDRKPNRLVGSLTALTEQQK